MTYPKQHSCWWTERCMSPARRAARLVPSRVQPAHLRGDHKGNTCLMEHSEEWSGERVCVPSVDRPPSLLLPRYRSQAPPRGLRSPSLISQQTPEARRRKVLQKWRHKGSKRWNDSPKEFGAGRGRAGTPHVLFQEDHRALTASLHTSPCCGPQSGCRAACPSSLHLHRCRSRVPAASGGNRTGGRTVWFRTFVPRKRRVGLSPAFFPANAEWPATESCPLHFRTVPSRRSLSPSFPHTPTTPIGGQVRS